jgi:hypothetical protein
MVSIPSPKPALIIVLVSNLMMSNSMMNSVFFFFCGLNYKGIETYLSAVKGKQPLLLTHTCCGYVKIRD